MSTCATSTPTTTGAGVTAVFQDFVRYELPLRDNVAPRGAPDASSSAALAAAGAARLAGLDTVLARGYDGGTDLSGGQWQRVALARALAAVRQGAGVVLLDEPTAQLDVRGEAEIFDRILPPPATAPRSSSRTGSPPSGRPTGSACSSTAGSSSSAPRRADGARRPLSHHVRPAGLALRRLDGPRSTSWARRSSMTRSTDDLPPALESLWRMMKLAYSHRAAAAVVSLAMTLFTALPQR